MGLLTRFRVKEALASDVGDGLGTSFWRQWDDPASVRSFCDSLKLNVRSDRVLLVLGAQQIFAFAFLQLMDQLGLEPRTAQIVSNHFGKQLALTGVARGHWDNPTVALDAMSTLGTRLLAVWAESEKKPPHPAWYVSKAMIEALTGAPPIETDADPVLRMHPYAHPGASIFVGVLDGLRAQGFTIVAR